MNPWLDTLLDPSPATPLETIDGYPAPSIKEERKLLAEIRGLMLPVPLSYVMSNGMPITTFSLWYILRRHLTRKMRGVESASPPSA
jgi:hypothetical protein